MMSDTYVNTRRFLAPFKTVTGKVQYFGFAILISIILLAIFAPIIASYSPTDPICDPFEKPSMLHILGCDDAGHDLLSQLLYGARVSLFVGLSVAFFATTVAVILAITAGLYGGWVDKLIMRIVDIALSLPFLPLVIVLGVFLGAALSTQIIVIAIVMWAHPVRELRAQILSIRSLDFIEAAQSMGGSRASIGVRHILPEIAPLIVPQFVRIAHNAILVETSLSFLGLGDPLQISWGTILYHANARAAFLTGAWSYWIVPAGLAVAITVTALAFIGFGYDASLAPRIAKRVKKYLGLKSDITPDLDAALSIRSLSISYHSEFGESQVVKNVDLDLHSGELLGLVGESGSGKTTIALAILRLLNPAAEVTAGQAWFEKLDLLGQNDQTIRALRGKKLALIPQSAMNALNPVLTIGNQLTEALNRGGGLTGKQLKLAVVDWLEKVGLQSHHQKSYPHELSGGMRQRAVIAIAICNNPDVVIADEPTTGLDVLVQEEIMALLLELRHSLNLSILFVTHNLPLIARHADRLAVMYHGQIVDCATPLELKTSATHEHTQDLFNSLPDINDEKRWPTREIANNKAIIELDDVSKSFSKLNALGLSYGHKHQALQNVNLKLHAGEKLGLVGGSGAGKSTILRIIMGIIRPDSGAVKLNSIPLSGSKYQALMAQYVHMVFQDPYQSMRNSMSIQDIVAEPLRIIGKYSANEIEQRVKAALKEVHLPNDGPFRSRLPVALSGGQRQRVAFARAIITNPKVIIADEPTSMLDQSVRMEIMELMDSLRERLGTAFIFVTHDIVLARHFCDQIIVLKDGEIVEQGLAEAIIKNPIHEYTNALIDAA